MLAKADIIIVGLHKPKQASSLSPGVNARSHKDRWNSECACRGTPLRAARHAGQALCLCDVVHFLPLIIHQPFGYNDASAATTSLDSVTRHPGGLDPTDWMFLFQCLQWREQGDRLFRESRERRSLSRQVEHG